MAAPSQMPLYRCQRCAFFNTKYMPLLTHIRDAHSWEPNFRVICGIGGCPKTYAVVDPLKKHVYRCHRSSVGIDVLPQDSDNAGTSRMDTGSGDRTAAETSHPSPPSAGTSNITVDETCVDASHETHRRSSEDAFSQFLARAQRKLCSYFFKLSEEYKIPYSTADSVFTDFRCLLKETLQEFSVAFRNNMPPSFTFNEEINKLLSCDFVDEMFLCCKSKYSRELYARQNLPYTAPQELKFTPQSVPTFQYVPVAGVLKNILEVPDIANAVFYSSQLSSSQYQKDIEILEDFRDGTVYRNMKDVLATSETETIYLSLYADEVEICNPLGAKRGIHKLFLVYFTILNIPAMYRSQLKAIHLLLVARYKDVSRLGHDKVLSPLLNDLQQLENEGLTLQTERGAIQAKVLVLTFCGDNLSIHSIGGFSGSFSRGRVCRYCMVHSDDLEIITNESMCNVRTDEIHAEHLASIAVNEDLKRMYGVSGPSPLLSLKYFSVCNQLPPDIMHDIFEGTVSQVLHSVLSGLISESVLSVADLDKIRTFSYGYNDRKNRPEPLMQSFLSSKGNLKGTASQKWCLLRLLPFIFSSQIPEHNQHWEIYLQFREITDMVLAEEVPVSWLPYLPQKIEEFMQKFVATYPNSSVTPKMHFLVHYPRMISQLGPLVQYWCMRFEAKHQYFKRLASRCMNFRNICKTLATRHQLLQSYQLSNLSLGSNVVSTGVKKVKPIDVPVVLQDMMHENEIWQATSATLNNLTYRKGDVLIMAKGEPPEFALVNSIYVLGQKVFLIMVPLKVVQFRRHRYSYQVTKKEELFTIQPGQEVSPQRLDLYFQGEVMPRCEIFF